MPASSTFHIPSLDGIRAVAVLLVVATHSGYRFASGALGVNVFFFLSGFLITTLLRRECDASGTIDIKAFYVRRALRILPPMYALLAVTMSLSVTGILPSVSASVALAQFFHLTNYAHILGHPLIPATEIMWSLSVEEHFYLLFPFAFVLLRNLSTRNQVITLISLCIAVAAWRTSVVANGWLSGAAWAYEATDTRMDSILWGAVMAIGLNPFLEPERTNWLNNRALVFVALIGLAVSQAYRAEWYTHTIRYTLQCFCFFPVFVLAIRRADGALRKVLNSRALVAIGEISYGMYLYHYVVVALLIEYVALPPVLTFLATLAITVAVCLISRAMIERPALRLKNAWSSERRSRS